MSNKESNYERFIKTNSYASLLKSYSLGESGIWQIFGEDPNCDMGGSHISPSLGFAEGTLNDVLLYAVELPDFWQWGAGGHVEKVDTIKKVNSTTMQRRRELQAVRASLMDSLKAVEAELEDL